jgi:hypothetical protein
MSVSKSKSAHAEEVLIMPEEATETTKIGAVTVQLTEPGTPKKKAGAPKGYKWSEEQKRKLSESMKARIAKYGAPKGYKWSEEQRSHLSAVTRARYAALKAEKEAAVH